MNPITFLTSGTRGDVQPVVALALALQGAGKPARVAAPPAFGAYVRAHGLPFAPVQGNPSDLMLEPGGQSALTFDGNPIRNARATLSYIRRAQPVYAQMLGSAFEACRDSSALVIGLPTLWGAHVAEALKIPCRGAFVQPVTPTREFPSPMLPFSFSLGAAYNRFSYRLAALATWLPWRETINHWREKAGLKRLASFDFIERLETVSYGFSPLVIPAPADWPSSARALGYWTLKSRAPGPIALQSFIEAGEAPVYIGFGSGGVRSPDWMTKTVVDALQKSDLRAVFALPPGASPQGLPAAVFPLTEPVDHAWLFPRMAGAVHHAGAGTTAAGLLAGIPTLACPQTMDQFFWAGRIHALGLGPAPLPQRSLTVSALADGFLQLRDEGMKRKAQWLAEKLTTEDGVAAFANWL